MVLELTPLMIQELTDKQINGCFNTIAVKQDVVASTVSNDLKRWWLNFMYVDTSIIAPPEVWNDGAYLYEAGLWAMHNLNDDADFYHAADHNQSGSFSYCNGFSGRLVAVKVQHPILNVKYTLHWQWSNDIIKVPTINCAVIHPYWFMRLFQRNANITELTHIEVDHYERTY